MMDIEITIVNALRVAAEQYQKDAYATEKPEGNSVARQFRDQCREALQLASDIEMLGLDVVVAGEGVR